MCGLSAATELMALLFKPSLKIAPAHRILASIDVVRRMVPHNAEHGGLPELVSSLVMALTVLDL